MDDQFNVAERAQMVSLIESIPWGDADAQLHCFETAFRLAFEATADFLPRWEESDGTPFEDEFHVAPEHVAQLSDESRLAYVARLLQTARFVYGVLQEQVWDEEPQTLAALLRGLNDIAQLGFSRQMTELDDATAQP